MVGRSGGWLGQHLYLAEGRCEGAITGRFRGANFPQRRTPQGPFCPDLRGVIETDDDAIILMHLHGYGRAHPPRRRQIVGFVTHLSDNDTYRHLNDSVCACVGGDLQPGDAFDVDGGRSADQGVHGVDVVTTTRRVPRRPPVGWAHLTHE